MAEEVFSREHPVASQLIWVNSSELTSKQLLVPVVDKWKLIEEGAEEGSIAAVSQVTGVRLPFTPGVVKKQNLKIGDIVEVREGPERKDDVVSVIRS